MLLILLAVVSAFWMSPTAKAGNAQERSPEEFEVGCIALLARETTWPKEAFQAPDAPLVVGIFGDTPFGKIIYGMTNIVVGKKSGNQAVAVRHVLVTQFKRIEDIKNCQLLFIGSSEILKVHDITEMLKNSATLTVGDHNLFNRMGGAVKLVPTRPKEPFEISKAKYTELKQMKVDLSFDLLDIAKKVE
jgi:hypothetical protein